jgi:hypothetical protein
VAGTGQHEDRRAWATCTSPSGSAGKRRASTRSSGRDCRARPSARTPSGSNSTRWRTTSPTSSARSPCPGEVERWSLTTLREKVVKIGAKVIGHGPYAIFQMAEVAVSRELFGRILETRSHADTRRVQRKAARGRAAPGLRPRGAAVRPDGARRRPGPPWRASRRQNTLACEAATALCKPRDGDGHCPSRKCRVR